MSRPRPENKPEPAPPAPRTVLPMQLRAGGRFADETGEWEIARRPYSTAGGRSVHASLRRVDQPATAQDRTWVAHERISVRASAEPSRRLLLITLEDCVYVCGAVINRTA